MSKVANLRADFCTAPYIKSQTGQRQRNHYADARRKFLQV